MTEIWLGVLAVACLCLAVAGGMVLAGLRQRGPLARLLEPHEGAHTAGAGTTSPASGPAYSPEIYDPEAEWRKRYSVPFTYGGGYESGWGEAAPPMTVELPSVLQAPAAGGLGSLPPRRVPRPPRATTLAEVQNPGRQRAAGPGSSWVTGPAVPLTDEQWVASLHDLPTCLDDPGPPTDERLERVVLPLGESEAEWLARMDAEGAVWRLSVGLEMA